MEDCECKINKSLLSVFLNILEGVGREFLGGDLDGQFRVELHPLLLAEEALAGGVEVAVGVELVVREGALGGVAEGALQFCAALTILEIVIFET